MGSKFKLEIIDEPIGRDEKLTVWRNMRQYGGNFVRLLGEALIYADPDNTRRIKEAWPEYWDRYLNLGKLGKEVEDAENGS